VHNFSPYSASIGGILIALSCLLLYYSNGRLAGISTIASKLVFSNPKQNIWRLCFVIGLIAGSLTAYQFISAPQARTGFPPLLLGLSGLLVGIGTSLANGCTSGHGVCGISRFSLRSFMATLIFLSSGIITCYIFRHMIGSLS